jgi:hypothetical protein
MGMSRAVALAVASALAVLGAAGAPAAGGAPALSYGCSPPLPATAAQCYAWHTGPVKLAWDWNQTLALPVGGDCTIQILSQDSAGHSVSCEIQDMLDLSTTEQTAVIRIDATPPTLANAEPARPPDHDGWWNHPVDLRFSGTDATSGIAGCDVIRYGGPDGADAQVTGGCRDQAGNVATRSFALRYDATPPSLSGLTAKPGNRKATLSWTTSPDAVLSEVVRTPGVGGAPASTLYGGSADTFTDAAALNGTTYRYTVSVHDAAENVASAASTATPSSIYAVAPGRNARLRKPPVLRWPRVAKAGYYNVQLFRGKHKILSAWPAANHLRLHRTWRFHGHRQRLKVGHYRWFVWPGFGARAARQYGSLIAHLGFYIDR